MVAQVATLPRHAHPPLPARVGRTPKPAGTAQEPTTAELRAIDLAAQQTDGAESADAPSAMNYPVEIRRFPLLCRDEEIALAQRIERGDEDAWRQLVNHNLRLSYTFARLWSNERGSSNGSMTFYDFVQEGNIGLMKAARKFDWRRGFKFSTVAYWWIRQQMSRAEADTARMIREPVHQQTKARTSKRARAQIAVDTGVAPEEVSESQLLAHGVAADAVQAERDAFQPVISLDRPSDKLPFHGNSRESDPTLGDYLVDRTPEAEVELRAADADADSRLAAFARKHLTQREFRVLYLRSMARETRSLEQIAALEGVTRERIRQIEMKAHCKLRAAGLTEDGSIDPCGPEARLAVRQLGLITRHASVAAVKTTTAQGATKTPRRSEDGRRREGARA